MCLPLGVRSPFPGLFFLAAKALGELVAIVGEPLDDGGWTGIVELDKEFGATAVGVVGIDLAEGAARGAVDGDK